MAKKKDDQKKKKTVLETSDLERMVLAYFEKANRPFALADVLLHFQNDITKTPAQRVLNTLVENQKLCCKTYGKTVIYVANQDDADVNQEELEELNRKLNNEKDKNSKLKEEIKTLNSVLSKILEYPSNSCLEEEIDKMNKTLKNNEIKLSEMRSGIRKISPEDMKKVDLELSKTNVILKKRKDIFKNTFNTLLDGLDMKKEDFMDELGIEGV